MTWLAQIGAFLFAKLADSIYPNLVGIFSSIISGLPGEVATDLHKAATFFHDQVTKGATWEDAATATLNYVQSEAVTLVEGLGQKLLDVFIHKAKT